MKTKHKVDILIGILIAFIIFNVIISDAGVLLGLNIGIFWCLFMNNLTEKQ